MSESDVLQRAAAALRAAHDGQREGSGFTRARILTSLSERPRPRAGRWLLVAPLASLLLVGSAWAQSTGNWARVWQAVATVLPFVQAPSATPAQPRRAPAVRPSPTPLPTPAPDSFTMAPPAPTPAPEQPLQEALPPAPVPSAKPASLPVAPRKSARSTPAEPALPADPELGTFRAAHELHVRGEARAAIAAYADYLRAYPRGRFVPEASYNTALDWIKLGDPAAARSALAPFADGAYGGYRQREARELLQALSERN